MASIAHHLVRRGMETLSSAAGTTSTIAEQGDKIKLPPWGVVLLLTTAFFFSFLLFSIQYTYGEVVAVLAAVEAPRSTAIIETPPPPAYQDLEAPDAPLLTGDEKDAISQQEILVIQERPLTSSFRTIKRHLRAQGGRLARYRGLHIYFMNALLFGVLRSAFAPFARGSPFLFTLFEILSIVAMTPFTLLWTHTVLAEPSSQSWFRRMPSRKTVTKALKPTLAYAATTRLATLAFIHLASTAQAYPWLPAGQEKPLTLIQRFPTTTLILLLHAIAITMFIQIPAEIAIVRVRASLLSTSETPIVPFDRTFAGQVVPDAEGSSSVLGFRQAWTSCEPATRSRVIGVYVKVLAMSTIVALAAGLMLVGELRVMLGKEYLSSLVRIAQNGGAF